MRARSGQQRIEHRDIIPAHLCAIVGTARYTPAAPTWNGDPADEARAAPCRVKDGAALGTATGLSVLASLRTIG